jgi:ribonuclease BN (tRNA processing enzyme)
MLNGTYPSLKLSFPISFVTLNQTDKISINDSVNIDILPAIHAVPTLSSIITAENKKVVYSSDTLPNSTLISASQGADFVVHEGMYTNDNFDNSRRAKHSTSLDAGNFAAAVNTKHIALVHIASKMFGDERKMLSEVASVYDGSASIPYDGSVYFV